MHEALGAAVGQRRARATALLLALSLCTAAASPPLASSGGHTRKLHRRCGRASGCLHPDARWRASLTCSCACRDMPRHSLPQAAQGLGTCNNTVQGR